MQIKLSKADKTQEYSASLRTHWEHVETDNILEYIFENLFDTNVYMIERDGIIITIGAFDDEVKEKEENKEMAQKFKELKKILNITA